MDVLAWQQMSCQSINKQRDAVSPCQVESVWGKVFQCSIKCSTAATQHLIHFSGKREEGHQGHGEKDEDRMKIKYGEARVSSTTQTSVCVCVSSGTVTLQLIAHRLGRWWSTPHRSTAVDIHPHTQPRQHEATAEVRLCVCVFVCARAGWMDLKPLCCV